MARRINRSRSRKSGQTLVEFALVLPVLLLVLLGIVEFGILLNNHLVVANAAREGARAAALGKTTTDIKDRIMALDGGATVNIATGDIDLKVASAASGPWSTNLSDSGGENTATSSQYIRVQVSTAHRQLTNFIPGLSGLMITKTVVMRREPT